MRAGVPIDGHTRVVFIVAHPVGHVKTPTLMNAFLEQNGINGVVVPAHVEPADLERVLQGLRRIHSLSGIIVTVPHKIEIMRHCDELDESAQIAGAVNVIRRSPEGKLIGANYDGSGFVRSIRDRIGDVRGKAVYMLGAGGVARAIAFSFARAGVGRLAIHNRTEDRAAELVEAVQRRCPGVEVGLADTRPKDFDVAVNASIVGMKTGDALPFSLDDLSRECLVADVIMQPLVTPLLEEARQRGNPICTGNGMLEHQLADFAEFLGLSQPALRP